MVNVVHDCDDMLLFDHAGLSVIVLYPTYYLGITYDHLSQSLILLF